MAYQEITEDLRSQSATSQEIEKTKSDLAASRQEADALSASITGLERQLGQLRREVSTAKTVRQELEGQAAGPRGKYSIAKSQLEKLLAVEKDLVSLSSLSTIREPALPTGPVSPQRNRNIALAATLGLFAGVVFALFWDFYRGQPSASRSTSE